MDAMDHSMMDHSNMNMTGMDHSGMEYNGKADMDHNGMTGMDHSGMTGMAGMHMMVSVFDTSFQNGIGIISPDNTPWTVSRMLIFSFNNINI